VFVDGYLPYISKIELCFKRPSRLKYLSMITSLISVKSSYVLNDHPDSSVCRWLAPLYQYNRVMF